MTPEQQEHDLVMAIGLRIGFGRILQLAPKCWSEYLQERGLAKEAADHAGGVNNVDELYARIEELESERDQARDELAELKIRYQECLRCHPDGDSWCTADIFEELQGLRAELESMTERYKRANAERDALARLQAELETVRCDLKACAIERDHAARSSKRNEDLLCAERECTEAQARNFAALQTGLSRLQAALAELRRRVEELAETYYSTDPEILGKTGTTFDRLRAILAETAPKEPASNPVSVDVSGVTVSIGDFIEVKWTSVSVYETKIVRRGQVTDIKPAHDGCPNGAALTLYSAWCDELFDCFASHYVRHLEPDERPDKAVGKADETKETHDQSAHTAPAKDTSQVEGNPAPREECEADAQGQVGPDGEHAREEAQDAAGQKCQVASDPVDEYPLSGAQAWEAMKRGCRVGTDIGETYWLNDGEVMISHSQCVGRRCTNLLRSDFYEPRGYRIVSEPEPASMLIDAECKWYSYDPECGYETHDHKHEAKAAAEGSIEDALDGDSGWHEGTDEIEWGELIPHERAVQTNRREDPSGEHDYLVEYVLKSVGPKPARPAPIPEPDCEPILGSKYLSAAVVAHGKGDPIRFDDPFLSASQGFPSITLGWPWSLASAWPMVMAEFGRFAMKSCAPGAMA